MRGRQGRDDDDGADKDDIDGYFAPAMDSGGAWADGGYSGLKVRHIDSTETGGCSYLIHLGMPSARKRSPPAKARSRP